MPKKSTKHDAIKPPKVFKKKIITDETIAPVQQRIGITPFAAECLAKVDQFQMQLMIFSQDVEKNLKPFNQIWLLEAWKTAQLMCHMYRLAINVPVDLDKWEADMAVGKAMQDAEAAKNSQPTPDNVTPIAQKNGTTH